MKMFATFAVGMLLASCVYGTSAVVLATPASAAPYPVNDLVVDFGPSRGLWVRLNNASWQKLDNQSPVAVGEGCWTGVAASFEGRGLLNLHLVGDHRVVRSDIVPFALAAGNVDGNGSCDIGALVRGPGNDVGLLVGLNHGADGYWIRPRLPKTITSFAFGNFDGKLGSDIAVVTGVGRLLVSYNNEPFEPPFQGGSGRPRLAVTTGDLWGDGMDEIIYADPIPVKLHAASLSLPRQPGELNIDLANADPVFAVGDLDADPVDDLLFTNVHGTFVLLNNTPSSVKVDSRRASSLAVADLDQNGVGDAIASFGGQGVWVRYGPANGFRLLRNWPVEALVPAVFGED